jgi:hypothetical protein
MRAGLILLVLTASLSGCVTPQEIYKKKLAQLRKEQRIETALRGPPAPR